MPILDWLQPSCNVLLIAPIDRPSSLDVNVNRNLTSITVQWGEVSCEDRNGEITGYRVEYNSTSPSHSGILTVSGADTRTAVLGGLLPSTTYTITVRAQGAPTAASVSDVRATTRPIGQYFYIITRTQVTVIFFLYRPSILSRWQPPPSQQYSVTE